MALNALAGGIRGGIAFLTRFPIHADEGDWGRFSSFPAAFPLVGYLIGALVAVPFVVPTIGATTAAFGYLLALVLVIGIPHLDGVADLGDAMAAHGDTRKKALKDTNVGVGAIVAVAIAVLGLVLAGIEIAQLPVLVAVGIVITAEVGAKLGMATVACLGTASHEGMGSAFTRGTDARLLLGPILVSLPAVFVFTPFPIGFAVIAAGPLVAVLLVRWATRTLGGVNGDIFGATNELGRVLALHMGVIAWTLS